MQIFIILDSYAAADAHLSDVKSDSAVDLDEVFGGDPVNVALGKRSQKRPHLSSCSERSSSDSESTVDINGNYINMY